MADGGCPTTAPTRGTPSRARTHPVRVVVALGVHNSINVSLQIGLVNRHEAVLLQAIIAAMLFRGVAVETSKESYTRSWPHKPQVRG